jgi:hypothetical protein
MVAGLIAQAVQTDVGADLQLLEGVPIQRTMLCANLEATWSILRLLDQDREIVHAHNVSSARCWT